MPKPLPLTSADVARLAAGERVGVWVAMDPPLPDDAPDEIRVGWQDTPPGEPLRFGFYDGDGEWRQSPLLPGDLVELGCPECEGPALPAWQCPACGSEGEGAPPAECPCSSHEIAVGYTCPANHDGGHTCYGVPLALGACPTCDGTGHLPATVTAEPKPERWCEECEGDGLIFGNEYSMSQDPGPNPCSTCDGSPPWGWRVEIARERERRGWADMIRRVTSWQRKTFPDQGPEAVAAHLLEEASEVAAAPTDGEEWADCWMLVVCGADRAGVDLYAAVESKLAKCEESEWRKVAGGYSKRVKGAEEAMGELTSGGGANWGKSARGIGRAGGC